MEIRSTVQINASRERVWQAWTLAGELTKWFSPQAYVEPREGGAFELYFNPADHEVDSTKGCKILAYEEPTRLVFHWKGPGPLAAIMNHEDALTRVEVTLQAIGDQTEVSVRHTGWGEGPEWEKAREWHVGAWDMMLKSLQKHLQDGGGAPCCE